MARAWDGARRRPSSRRPRPRGRSSRRSSTPGPPTGWAMPELPEVEVVRRGLERFVVGRRIDAVEVAHPRSVRRHTGGPVDFAARLVGSRVVAARRRGKYLWLAMQDGSALLGHLGMSGQLLVRPHDAP